MRQIKTEKETDFESIKHLDHQSGTEFWQARELMKLLEYTKWSNFNNVILKAKASIKTTYSQTEDHFAEVSKKIKIAQGTDKEAIRKIKDYKLSRRACYLIAQNGDSSKKSIALAQNYFASQTRNQEIQELKEKDIERILARRKLSESEKKFTGIMSNRGINSRGIAEIKSSGDQAMLGKPTREVKDKLGIKN
ncbi:MAG: hypothetical protein Q9M91_02905 [Candidatus Dojkabacteria bacterium]|nr:hypothetical protein [Candidatus Dojkabacteria bacterium]MDQ7020773.1 hypothetical protein [Candidatus Dojkabacteria bacterium]